MSICICTPKQKDSGRYSKRCTAHHGHSVVSITITKLYSDFRLIEDSNKTKHPAWIPFKKVMKGKQYGRESLNSAWSFFKSGFEAAVLALASEHTIVKVRK